VTSSRWPDAIVGAGLAALWLRTSLRFLGEARTEARAQRAGAPL